MADYMSIGILMNTVLWDEDATNQLTRGLSTGVMVTPEVVASEKMKRSACMQGIVFSEERGYIQLFYSDMWLMTRAPNHFWLLLMGLKWFGYWKNQFH
jgi:hypothetical protein